MTECMECELNELLARADKRIAEAEALNDPVAKLKAKHFYRDITNIMYEWNMAGGKYDGYKKHGEAFIKTGDLAELTVMLTHKLPDEKWHWLKTERKLRVIPLKPKATGSRRGWITPLGVYVLCCFIAWTLAILLVNWAF
jgi:hypothetical protein